MGGEAGAREDDQRGEGTVGERVEGETGSVHKKSIPCHTCFVRIDLS